MDKGYMSFTCDTVAFLNEIADNALARNMGVLKTPLNIFRELLACVAQRAIELDDPQLNILMLRMELYEVTHDRIHEFIEAQKKRL